MYGKEFVYPCHDLNSSFLRQLHKLDVTWWRDGTTEKAYFDIPSELCSPSLSLTCLTFTLNASSAYPIGAEKEEQLSASRDHTLTNVDWWKMEQEGEKIVKWKRGTITARGRGMG